MAPATIQGMTLVDGETPAHGQLYRFACSQGTHISVVYDDQGVLGVGS